MNRTDGQTKQRVSAAAGSAAVPSPFVVDESRAADLRRMKMMATSLLVIAGIIFVIARRLEVDGNAWGYVRAAAEASMVGALADWFAVTALFKHPLGLPIPHTAIIQKRKDEIGASLGSFVQDNFLTRPVITERLREAKLAQRLGDWLAEPGNATLVGEQSAAVVRGMTEVLQDEVIQGGIEAVVVERAKSVKVAPIMSRVVDAAILGDHHQTLLEGVLAGLGTFMEDNRETFRHRLTQESPWWVPEPVDDAVFDKIYTGVRRFLTDIGSDRNHEMRVDIDRRTARLAEELRTSPAMIERGEALKEEFLDHPEVRAWSATLWERIKSGLLEAAESPDSELRQRLEEALTEAGRSLSDDPELRAKIDTWIVEAVGYIADQFRGEVADLIATTVQRWDTAETAERIELQVGRDLQFIRINGTLVGGLAGLAIHAVSELLLT
ncbi:MAG: DUF445 family protein [Acidimicrobiia bacterium]|nr:DUF445 family protein [Acidimicrobiia bacterium]MDH5521099.1 DUF445 family protein [Acidimicrobiia bacterium]